MNRSLKVLAGLARRGGIVAQRQTASSSCAFRETHRTMTGFDQYPYTFRHFSANSRLDAAQDGIVMDHFKVSESKACGTKKQDEAVSPALDREKATAANIDDMDDDDEMEQEDMFVEPHESFEFRNLEWGGPRRGGRYPEPTRYGDWERKGRCTDF